MSNEAACAELLKPCTCAAEYTIEPHGDVHNLINMVEPPRTEND